MQLVVVERPLGAKSGPLTVSQHPLSHPSLPDHDPLPPRRPRTRSISIALRSVDAPRHRLVSVRPSYPPSVSARGPFSAIPARAR